MKNTIKHQAEISNETKQQLPEVVNEILATPDFKVEGKTNFTAAELWKSRKNSVSASSRIRKWSLN
ncbi:MAG: hypothetical protein RIR12_1866 [Bacteroidota bacterium]|jgi:tripartite-type tricarboxylate transporter receptor subunit TctC